jgi:RNA polymerase sigma factor (sigma-70 family)
VTNKEVNHIIQQFKTGDRTGFGELVAHYTSLVYALALKMADSTEDAEEITQDAFLKAYKGLAHFKGNSKFSTWLYQITYFTAINYLRKKKINTVDLSFDREDIAHENSLKKLEQADREKYLTNAMSFLKPDERAIITLFHLEENTIEEVAAITKLSPSNVKVKVHRTRKKLYGILKVLLKSEINLMREF